MHGLTVFDYDTDGDMDIYQANDHQLNFMFRNDKGVYKEVPLPLAWRAIAWENQPDRCMARLAMWMVTG